MLELNADGSIWEKTNKCHLEVNYQNIFQEKIETAWEKLSFLAKTLYMKGE